MERGEGPPQKSFKREKLNFFAKVKTGHENVPGSLPYLCIGELSHRLNLLKQKKNRKGFEGSEPSLKKKKKRTNRPVAERSTSAHGTPKHAPRGGEIEEG